MQNRYINHMFGDLIRDFGQPVIAYQAGVLVGCLLVAYALARLFKRLMGRRRDAANAVLQFSVESLNKAMFPLLGWIFVLCAQMALDAFIHTALLSLALVPLFGISVIYLVLYCVRRAFSRSGSTPALLMFFQRVVTVLVWLGMVLYVTGVQDDLLRWMGSIKFNIANAHMSLLSLSTGLLWVGLTVVVALWAGAALEDRLMRSRSLDANLKVVMARVSKAVLILAALLLSLELVGIDVTVLGVFGGALGVGLGFGLQKIASNYVSGFIILLERSLRLGDQITVAGYAGLVTQIKTRYTVVRGLDGVETLIPNEKLITDAVQNHSSYLTRGYTKLPVQISYSSNVDLAMKLLLQATEAVPRLLQEPAPAAYLTGFGGDGINFELTFWIEDAAQGTALVRSSVNQAIWRLFSAHGIEIPFAQREVRIVGEMPLAAQPAAFARDREAADPAVLAPAGLPAAAGSAGASAGEGK
jgi:small-conductance mechanosensitive channel